MLVTVYALFGFLALPSIVRGRINAYISETLGRPGELAELRFNPFALSIRANRLSISQADGNPLAGFKELRVNFQLSSLYRRAFTFEELAVVEPYVHIKVLADGTLNTSTLFATDQQETPEKQPDVAAEPIPLIIGRLSIEGGRLAFRDESIPTPYDAVLAPVDVTLDGFSTNRESEGAPYAFTATTGHGEKLEWEGDLTSNPLRSEGRFKITGVRARTLWEYARHNLRFEPTGGTIDVSADYTLDGANENIGLTLHDGAMSVRELQIGPKVYAGNTRPTVISVPDFHVRETRMDLRARSVTLGSVTTMGGTIRIALDRDGTANLVQLFSAAEAGPVENGIPVREDAAAPVRQQLATSGTDAPPWTIVVEEAKAENYYVSFLDLSGSPPVEVIFKPLGITVTGYTSAPPSPFHVRVDTGLGEDGKLSVEGDGTLAPLRADIDVDLEGLSLPALGGYVGRAAVVSIKSGSAGLKGKLAYRAKPEASEAEVNYRGSLSVDGLHTKDNTLHETFLRLEHLALSGIDLRFEPTSIIVDRAEVAGARVRTIVDHEGVRNIDRIFVTTEVAPDTEAIETEAPTATGDAGAVIPVRIGTITLEDSGADYTDLSLDPVFTTGLEALSGTVTGLSSEQTARAKVALSGTLNRYASVRIDGSVNPLATDAYTDLRISAKNVGMTAFAPYSGKFLGYLIDKGKLFLDISYKVEKGRLTARNQIRMDQLSFGDRTESSEATNLPVALALALLKNPAGEINIDLPMRGDTNDPEFSYGKLIIGTFLNLITKIVTSPFSIIGGLIPDLSGDALKFVAFDAGSAALGESSASKLDKLAGALKKRPALRLEVRGEALQGYDGRALRALSVDRRLKIASLGRNYDPSMGHKEVDAVSLSERDVAKYTERLYEETFDESRRGARSRLRVQWEAEGLGRPDDEDDRVRAHMRARLLAAEPVGESSLSTLAQARSRAVQDRLLGAGIEPDRVFLEGSEIDPDESATTPKVHLNLAGG